MDGKQEIPVADIDTRPDQPRKIFEPAPLTDLGENLLKFGQLIPIIVYFLQSARRYILVDGERRWRAAKLVGIKKLIAIVLEREPTASELHQIQNSIDAHRIDLSAMERSDLLSKIKQENNWSISELAEKLNMKQPLVTKLLKFQDGCPELREALHAGLLDQDKAYTIAGEPDHAKQRELLKQVNGLTREQLRQKARSGGKTVEVKTTVARFMLPDGAVVTVQGRRMNLSGAIDAMLEAVKELKKGQAERWDITTAMRVLRDKAKSTQQSA
jgi:ParB family chromosome partitioning protein